MKYINYYVRRMIRHNLWKYLIYFACIAFVMLLEVIHARQYMEIVGFDADFGASFLYIDLFMGMKEYFSGIGIRFEIPYIWLLNSILIIFTVGDFNSKNSGMQDYKAFILSGNRKNMGLGILLGGIVNIFLIFMMILVNVMISAFFLGWKYDGSCMLLARMYNFDLQILYEKENVLSMIILPVVGVMLMVFTQIFLCEFFGSRTAFLTSFILTIAGAYYKSYFLFTNYYMILRYGFLCEKGIQFKAALLITLIVMITYVAILFGKNENRNLL